MARKLRRIARRTVSMLSSSVALRAFASPRAAVSRSMIVVIDVTISSFCCSICWTGGATGTSISLYTTRSTSCTTICGGGGGGGGGTEARSATCPSSWATRRRDSSSAER